MREEKRRKNKDFTLFRHRPEDNYGGEDYEGGIPLEPWKTYLGLGLIIVIILIVSVVALRTKIVETKEVASAYAGAAPSVEAITGTLVRNEEGEDAELYEMAKELGFTGTQEEFFTFLADRNTDLMDIRSNVDELTQLVAEMETALAEASASGKDGIAGRNGKDGNDGADGRDGKDGDDGADGDDGTDGEDGRDGAAGKDGDDGKKGDDGKDGKAGKDGEDGQTGADGQNGRDGNNGRSTYIAYAEDNAGKGFSLAPTENSKYIGTCVTAAASQPSNPREYSWQLYRSYIITAITENDTTTLYIK